MNLDTTNQLLGVMAAVSVLEALLLVGFAIGGFMAYRRMTQLVTDLEARQIAPLRDKVDAILTDVKTVTARVSEQTERVDHAIVGHDGARRRNGGAREGLGTREGQSRRRRRSRRAGGHHVAAWRRLEAQAANRSRRTGVRQFSTRAKPPACAGT